MRPPLYPTGEPSIRVIAMPGDANPAGDIFGGWLMSQMDLAAGNVAARLARGRVVTVAVESMTFLHPVFVGDEVSVFAEVDRRGRSSVRVVVEAWRRPTTGEDTTKVTEGAFTFVAIGSDRRPRSLDPDVEATSSPSGPE